MQLELLLLAFGRRDRAWTAGDLAREMRIDPAWVDAQLRSMTGKGFFEIAADEPAQPARFRFAPRTPGHDRAVADLAQAYADRRVSVIGLIFSKPVDKLRSFADAFRLRKGPTDG